ncbi:MAG TPA: two-component sensor histidine kinase, partial [Ruminococcus sp.]|nr:two-component sensor histidine kinase [Ruminococcus sp.]
MNGTFSESDYNESKLSSLESKWYRYLKSSKLSEQKINLEREKIKELVSDISHQTKTPLTNINLYSQLLLEQNLDDESKYLADEIQKQTLKLNFLIQSLIKTSRLETGTFQLTPQKNSFDTLIVKSVEQLKKKAENKNIKIN